MSDHSEPAQTGENGDGEDQDYVEDTNNSLSEDLGDDNQASLVNEESALLNETSELDDTSDEASLERIRMKMKEMEEEASRLKQYHAEEMSMTSPTATPTAPPTFLSPEEKKEVDARSIYVGNVDYGATAEELESHFHGCGSINRVTINCDKYSGHPKGYAYIEFTDTESVETAQALDDSLFRGRQIKVVSKRTNIPGHSSTNRPPRGRGRFRSRGYRGFRGRSSYRGGYRGRGRGYYSPY